MTGYKTPAALEMAVKEAAKASPLDTNRAIEGFYLHRLLCRIFAECNDSFVLKGGRGMLARTIDARTTRDIDLESKRGRMDDALAELRALAETDLKDFITFEYVGSKPIKAEDEYRSGLAVKFIPLLGAKRMQAISIDLVIDEVPCEDAEHITPADRIDVGGIEVCDYLVCCVEGALADKFCAIAERHDGRPSSRVKDLVDIIVYATTCDVDGRLLQKRIRREASVRKLDLPTSFAIPEEWKESYADAFTRLCAQTEIRESCGHSAPPQLSPGTSSKQPSKEMPRIKHGERKSLTGSLNQKLARLPKVEPKCQQDTIKTESDYTHQTIC